FVHVLLSALFPCRDYCHRRASGPAACTVPLPLPRCRLSRNHVRRVSFQQGRPTATRVPLNTASAGRNVIEDTRKAAWSFFDKGQPAAEEWVAAQPRKILHGNASQVAAGIRRRATTYGYSPAERAGADECARYLDNKKDYLDYATALANGWPIATGM